MSVHLRLVASIGSSANQFAFTVRSENLHELLSKLIIEWLYAQPGQLREIVNKILPLEKGGGVVKSGNRKNLDKLLIFYQNKYFILNFCRKIRLEPSHRRGGRGGNGIDP